MLSHSASSGQRDTFFPSEIDATSCEFDMKFSLGGAADGETASETCCSPEIAKCAKSLQARLPPEPFI
jgi:hypothetical protein